MGLRFTVLASGSGGNASLIEANDFGLLLDVGLGPRQLAGRLTAVGASWQSVQAVLLTHTHTDHWREATLTHLRRRGIPLYCHTSHHATLRTYSESFALLEAAGLVRRFEAGEELILAEGLRCRPLPVCHDGGATFGFRLEGNADPCGQTCALAYAADLGCWDTALAEALADVELLALEFNHDVALECNSGRHPRLIARVLGDEGHLSNEQAAALLREVVRCSAPGRLRHLVQLHLSRECNHPELALESATRALQELAVQAEVHTAAQDEPGATLHVGSPEHDEPRPQRAARVVPPKRWRQSWLPGFEG